MTHILSYLTFGGNCREAMQYYRQCLGGELSVSTVGSSPMALLCQPALHERILHASLVKDGMVILAVDSLDNHDLVVGNNVSLCLSCGTEEEIDEAYTRLSEGGRVVHRLTNQPGGGVFGMLQDRFGICWVLTLNATNKDNNYKF